MKYADMGNSITNEISVTMNADMEKAISSAKAVRTLSMEIEAIEKQAKTTVLSDEEKVSLGLKKNARDEQQKVYDDSVASVQKVFDDIYINYLVSGSESAQDIFRKYFADMFRPFYSVRVTVRNNSVTGANSSFSGDKDVMCYPFESVLKLIDKKAKDDNTGKYTIKWTVPDEGEKSFSELIRSAMKCVFAYLIESFDYEGDAKNALIAQWENNFTAVKQYSKCKGSKQTQRRMQDVINAMLGLSEEEKVTIRFKTGMIARWATFDGANKRNRKNGAMVFCNADTFISTMNFVIYEAVSGNNLDVEFSK